jgi:CRP-like cAMP-binding protein
VDRAPGQVFVVEGQRADAIYLLLSGAARVFYPAKKERPKVTVKLMQAPGGFGDVACVTGSGYTASVEAWRAACVTTPLIMKTVSPVAGRLFGRKGSTIEGAVKGA